MTFLSEKNLVICIIIVLIVLFLVYLNKNQTPYELGLINNPKIEKFVETETVSSESSVEEEEQYQKNYFDCSSKQYLENISEKIF